MVNFYIQVGVVYEHSKIKNLFSYKYNYAKAKITNEKIIRTVLSKKIKCSVVRCFSFVGKYLSLNSKYVIGNIINSILNQKKIIIKDRGKIYRSYMHANDLSKNLLKALNQSSHLCTTYNIGSNDEVDLKKIAYTLSKKFNLKLEFKNQIYQNDKYFPKLYENNNIKNLSSNKKSINAIIETLNEFKK